MSELGKFIAFQAAVALHRRAGRQSLLDRIYDECREELKRPPAERRNRVKKVYEAFTDEEISAEISRMVYPENIDWHGEVAGDLPNHREPPRLDQGRLRRLVFHRRLSHARRLLDGQPRLYPLV